MDLLFSHFLVVYFKMPKLWFYDFPVGKMCIIEEDGEIAGVYFDEEKWAEDYELEETPLMRKASMQLGEYFAGEREVFDLPLLIRGTDFQMAVWWEMQKIPFGETRSYKDLAVGIGKPRAVRAVGMACNRNKVSIIIPCHRVVGSGGKLTGYAGGLSKKAFLLDLERG